MEDIPRQLIEQAQSGDMAAFEQIYRATAGFVYSVALRITGSAEEAQEATQDVYMKVYRSIDKFEFRSQFKTWLYRIAANTAINAYNRQSRDFRRRDDFDAILAVVPAKDDIAAEVSGREERRLAEGRLQSLLDRLNPDQRACLVLREIEGLSYEEISQALRCNLNTVRTRLKRAREALMQLSSERTSP
ncbi:MAG: sigma-70 family RNA polymerase sigma factor [Candidatus Omnitrophica bacterium]|nr:sigma-70 family RNA polymerase sigma factor [Candidatus Omnitrophota bacterium]